MTILKIKMGFYNFKSLVYLMQKGNFMKIRLLNIVPNGVKAPRRTRLYRTFQQWRSQFELDILNKCRITSEIYTHVLISGNNYIIPVPITYWLIWPRPSTRIPAPGSYFLVDPSLVNIALYLVWSMTGSRENFLFYRNNAFSLYDLIYLFWQRTCQKRDQAPRL